jgi:hypothetical protein
VITEWPGNIANKSLMKRPSSCGKGRIAHDYEPVCRPKCRVFVGYSRRLGSAVPDLPGLLPEV